MEEEKEEVVDEKVKEEEKEKEEKKSPACACCSFLVKEQTGQKSEFFPPTSLSPDQGSTQYKKGERSTRQSDAGQHTRTHTLSVVCLCLSV